MVIDLRTCIGCHACSVACNPTRDGVLTQQEHNSCSRLAFGQTLTAAGAEEAALAVLIAGPIINLPSLFVLAREASPRIALLLLLIVWLVASIAGMAFG